MNEDLNDLAVFAAVVEAGTFTGAAQRLDMPKSTVSTRVMRLEKRLNARLLERSTRHQSLTEAGRVYFDACRRVLEEAENGRKALAGFIDEPRGTLRVSLPFAFARSMLAPRIADFLDRYPDIHLHLQVNNHRVDLVRENIDVALRVQRRVGEDEVALPVTTVEQKLVASACYADRHGLPHSPRELTQHRMLAACDAFGISEFWQETGRSELVVKVKPHIAVGEPETRAELIKNGHGIGWLPSFLCDTELKSGTLIQCLEDYPIPRATIHAVTPSIRSNDHRVRIFLDFLKISFEKFPV